MRHTDIAIVGGGLAGSTAAAVLGRAGISTVLIDPHQVHPPELRCEKISGQPQLERFFRTGLADAVLPATTLDGENWIARFGILIDKKPSRQYGIMYDALVNAVRAAIPASVETIHAKATSIATSTERQTVTLSNGEEISARLVVMANGLNVGLREKLGIQRHVISPCHSISIGFDIAPVGRAAFAFPAMTYFSERTVHRTAYLTLFPIGDRMRGNLFVYRSADDPWLREMRRTPEQALDSCLPKLRRLTGDYKITGDIRIRPADLYVSSGYRQAGVVLIGDAFASPCPGSGTGTDKVFTDVERLCRVHIPTWLATSGMGADKIAAFYDDPVKTTCDIRATAKAFTLRSVTIEDGLLWQARRWTRFFGRLGEGLARRTRDRLSRRSTADSAIGGLSPAAPRAHPDNF